MLTDIVVYETKPFVSTNVIVVCLLRVTPDCGSKPRVVCSVCHMRSTFYNRSRPNQITNIDGKNHVNGQRTDETTKDYELSWKVGLTRATRWSTASPAIGKHEKSGLQVLFEICCVGLSPCDRKG
jgi:hypothetical protein